VLLLGACSSGSSSDSDQPAADPRFEQLVDGFDNGTLAPVPGGADSSGATVTAADGTGVNVGCLATEINKRVSEGDYTASDVALWVQGLPSELVQKAADEIIASGQCAK
jgi:hypothetical protein